MTEDRMTAEDAAYFEQGTDRKYTWTMGRKLRDKVLATYVECERLTAENKRWKAENSLMAAHQGIDNYQRMLDEIERLRALPTPAPSEGTPPEVPELTKRDVSLFSIILQEFPTTLAKQMPALKRCLAAAEYVRALRQKEGR